MNTEQERAELLPCPFCGGTPEIVERDVEPHGDPWYGRKFEKFVECECGACLFDEAFHEGFYSEEKAVEAWNRRAALQSQDREGAVDPLQPAVDWLNEAIIDLTATDIQRRLFIGHNRAQRLLDHARRVEEKK